MCKERYCKICKHGLKFRSLITKDNPDINEGFYCGLKWYKAIKKISDGEDCPFKLEMLVDEED